MNPAAKYKRRTSTPLRLGFRARRIISWVEEDPFTAVNVVCATIAAIVTIGVIIAIRIGWISYTY
jgi:hypothetical protein